jgi:hypothetical protein
VGFGYGCYGEVLKVCLSRAMVVRDPFDIEIRIAVSLFCFSFAAFTLCPDRGFANDVANLLMESDSFA